MKIATPLTHDHALALWNAAEIQDSTIAGAVVKLLMAVDVASREQAKGESPTPPMVCTGSWRTPAQLSAATGSGTCGICRQEVGVGPLGICATHPWPGGPAAAEPERPPDALIRWLDENVRKCDHGYVFATCGPCMSAWLPPVGGVASGRFGPG